MNSAWVRLSSETIQNFYHIPEEYAENPNHHFYAQRLLEMDTFRLIGFNLDNSRDGSLELRFWTLEDDLLSPKHDILEEKFSGYITIYQNEIKDFIQLLDIYTQQINPVSKAKDQQTIDAFQLIDKNDYANKGINQDFASRKNFIYRPLIPDSELGLSTNRKLLYIAPEKRLIIKIIKLPASANTHEFGHFWRNPEGSLVLSRKGLQAFSKILHNTTK